MEQRVALAIILICATILNSQGVVVDGPSDTIYFPGQGPVELMCNLTVGTTVWRVNGTTYTLTQLAEGRLAGHSRNGSNIVVNEPVNNTEYICVSTSNDADVSSEPAFIYIADVPNQVPGFMVVSDSVTLDGDMLNLTLYWGEPFNNFDPIRNYTVSCSGDVQCPENFTTADNTTRMYTLSNLTATTNHTFTVVATNTVGSGEDAILMITGLSLPSEVTGLSITCNPSYELPENNCTATWNAVTMGDGPLEQPLYYTVYYNGSFVNVSRENTFLSFPPPTLPRDDFVGNTSVRVYATNRFGIGPRGGLVSDEIMASSVIDATATLNTPDDNRILHEVTVNCTIHPASNADECIVILIGGRVNRTGSGAIVNRTAMVNIAGLDCIESYTITAGGTYNDALVGPRSIHGTIEGGPCPVTATPTPTITATQSATNTIGATPTGTPRGGGGGADGIKYSLFLIALTTVINMMMSQW